MPKVTPGERPPKLTKEREDRLVQLIHDGNYRETACKAVNIGVAMFRKWLKKGEGDEAVEPYVTFAARIREAEANAEELAVSALRAAGLPPPGTQCTKCKGICLACARERGFDWRATESWLRRRHADRWGDQIQMRIQKEVDEAKNSEQDRILGALERVCERTNDVQLLENIYLELEREDSGATAEAPAEAQEPLTH